MEGYMPFSPEAAPKRLKNIKKNTNFKKGKKSNKGKNVKITDKVEATEQRPSHKMKLLFQERCPEPSEVRKLHPLIQYVFRPQRPPSIRYCLLKFESSEDLEEVRAALHKKHIEPFKGFLKCLKTESETLKEIKMSRPELLNEEYLTKVDVKHAKLVHNENLRATLDVKCNSTARELFVRYGIGIPFISNGENQNSVFVSTDPEQNGASPSLSSDGEDDGMD